MNFENEIKQIKDTYNANIINKAKTEERRKAFLEQEQKIVEQCHSLGIKPEELATKKQEKIDLMQAKLAECRQALNISDPEQDTPF